MTKNTLLLWGCFVSIVLPGCSSMQEINDYSKISQFSLKKINHLQYTFNDYCTRNCELKKLRYNVLDTNDTCTCLPIAKNADSTLLKIHTIISSYIDAIEKLSSNNTFRYDVSGLTSSIQSNSFIKVTEQQKNTINKAGNFLATIGTFYYRKKTLKKYIVQANPIFTDIMDTYIFLIDERLREQLKLDYAMHKTNFEQMFDNTDNNSPIRQFIIKEMIKENNWYATRNALLNNYIDLLKKVKDGHHQIYLERERLSDTSFIHLMKRYTTEVKSLVESVQQ